MKLDDILQVMANYLGTEVVSLRDANLRPNCCRRFRPMSRACISACPSRCTTARCRWRWPTRWTRRAPDEIHFAVKQDVQVVVADPAEIEKAIDQHYGQEDSGDVSGNSQGTGRGRRNRPRSERSRATTRSWLKIWPTRRPS